MFYVECAEASLAFSSCGKKYVNHVMQHFLPEVKENQSLLSTVSVKLKNLLVMCLWCFYEYSKVLREESCFESSAQEVHPPPQPLT